MKSFIFFILTISLINYKGFSQNHELVITEIFADPTPSKGLPEVEFIEIKNLTQNSISLKGYTFKYADVSVLMPDSILKANEIAIVCRKTNEALLKPFGKTIGLSNFSLNNEGALLILFNQKKEIVTWVNYDKSWYTNNKTEGFSLEMIDTRYACRGKENWGSSSDPIGATPGKNNSLDNVNPDTQEPKILSYSIERNSINLLFDENLDFGFLSNSINFDVLDADNTLREVSFDQFKPNELWLNLNNEIQQNQTLKIGINNLSDCSGNLSDYFELEIINVPLPDSGQILISEVLFNPRLGSEDFVELKNVTNKPLNIKNMKIAGIDKEENLESISILSSRDWVIQPGDFVAFTTNKQSLIKEYPFSSSATKIIELGKMPSYNNDKGSVVLIGPDDRIYDILEFDEKMHHASIKNPDGVSLERIDFKVSSSLKNNWMSASALYNYASPGKSNSQQLIDKFSSEFWVEYQIFFPLSSSNNIAILNYIIPLPGTSASVTIRNKEGKVCKNLINNSILGTSGQILWDGTDDTGKMLPVGYYVFEIKLFSGKESSQNLIKIVLGEY